MPVRVLNCPDSDKSSGVTAVNNLITSGIPVVVAAGKETAQAYTKSPSNVPNAITVAAIEKFDVFSSFSNYGTCVDISAN